MADPRPQLDLLSKICKPPHQLVTGEIGLDFVIGLCPKESSTDDDPPDWEERDELWGIDNFLGKYSAKERQIIIFDKAIDFVSAKLNVNSSRLKYIVRLHEWSHAAFHIAVCQEERYILAKLLSEEDEEKIDTHSKKLLCAYNSTDSYVHEQFAQALTYLALNRLYSDSTLDEARKICESLQDLFQTLMKHQRCSYRLDDRLFNLENEELGKRLGSIIPLLRSGKVRGDQETWDTIIAW